MTTERSGAKLLTGYYRPVDPPGPLMCQGAEARIYVGSIHAGWLKDDSPCIVKERFIKTYRQPELDVRLSRVRLRAEARLLLNARQIGVPTPAVLHVDTDASRRQIWLELIGSVQHSTCVDGASSSSASSYTLGAWLRGLLAEASGDGVTNETLKCVNECLVKVADQVGTTIARLHANNIIHGDLTMANILLKFVSYAVTYAVKLKIIPKC